MFLHTTATKKLTKLNKRIRIVAGGTSAGKTISILQLLIDYAQSDKGQLISVVSESFPHLKRGAIRDFLNIMQSHGYYEENSWNRSDYTYTFDTGSKIEFFSADQPGKVRGPRRDILFVNEANNIGYEEFDQLRIRTRKVIWLDFNPTNEFWAYTEIMPIYDHDFITLTYKDNEGLDQSIIKDIEAHKHNHNWWLVYGLGQLGEVEGRIFTGWTILDSIPEKARLERRGLDFGYSNDPTAVVDIWYLDGGFILDERIYRKGMSNKDIADWLKAYDDNNTKVYADSAEPKSIDEISSYGIHIIPAQKGAGSVVQGIQYVQDQRISMTKRSVNLIKEYRNYMWQTDKDGRIINKPEDLNNHCMDAIRYALESYSRNYSREVGVVTSNITEPRKESFIANSDGVLEAFHIDVGELAKKNMQQERDWRYN